MNETSETSTASAFELPALTATGERTETTRCHRLARTVEWQDEGGRRFQVAAVEITYVLDTTEQASGFGWGVQDIALLSPPLPDGAVARTYWHPGTTYFDQRAPEIARAVYARLPKPSPTTRLDVVVERDSDSDTTTTVFADGAQLPTGPLLEIHNIDPGRSGGGCDWFAAVRQHGDRVPRAVRDLIDQTAEFYHSGCAFAGGEQ
ncbi:hypothetical protein [Streptacidiphilus cavernicola]|uniref:DUF317 domain-containing protein n=1 Tax=Streptacidiphilus cavernicola TaxID=3342716 RepID=A0ABV6VYR5_9ACTN